MYIYTHIYIYIYKYIYFCIYNEDSRAKLMVPSSMLIRSVFEMNASAVKKNQLEKKKSGTTTHYVPSEKIRLSKERNR